MLGFRSNRASFFPPTKTCEIIFFRCSPSFNLKEDNRAIIRRSRPPINDEVSGFLVFLISRFVTAEFPFLLASPRSMSAPNGVAGCVGLDRALI